MFTEDVWDLMTSAFTYERRRSINQFEEVCAKEIYQILELRSEAGKLQGFVGLWKLDDWVAIEHVAVQSDEIYSAIVGVLLKMVKELYNDDFKIIKKIDIISGENNKELINIYSKAGFIENPYIYIQPSFHQDSANFPQHILSYPTSISYNEFKALRSLLYCHCL